MDYCKSISAKEVFVMGIAFQIVSVILIIGAVLLFCKRTSGNTIITKGQKALSVFQIVLCADISFSDCLCSVGSKAKKAKECPDDCLLLRCVDCSAVLYFSI